MVTPPAGFTTLAETYRGVEIWYSPDADVYYYEPKAGSPTYTTLLEDVKAWIDHVLEAALPARAYICPTCGASFLTEAMMLAHIASAHPPVTPPTAKDYLAETYRGVEVWWIVAISMYRAQVAAGYTAVGLTLPEVRKGVDGILAYFNPPPGGGDSLLGQIVATIQAWISPLLTPLQNAWSNFQTVTWPSWTSSFTSLKASWDQFYTYTLGNMMDNLRGLRATWDTFWTRDYPAMLAARKAKEDALEALIETRKTELEAGTIKGDTDTRDWVTQGFLDMLTARIGKVPPQIFSGIFGFLSSGWAQGAAEAFRRGLDKGLEE